jgi:transposase
MSATHAVHSTPTAAPVLYVAFELSWGTWKMAFTVGAGQPPRIRSVPARCATLVLNEIKKAKLRFDLPADTPVLSCYEAGRDGFWIHRVLAHEGIHNIVVDSASIEVSRRKRRAKSDRLDAVKLERSRGDTHSARPSRFAKWMSATRGQGAQTNWFLERLRPLSERFGAQPRAARPK